MAVGASAVRGLGSASAPSHQECNSARERKRQTGVLPPPASGSQSVRGASQATSVIFTS
jgi:hypothetical protein